MARRRLAVFRFGKSIIDLIKSKNPNRRETIALDLGDAWCDDSTSSDYNKFVKLPNGKSHKAYSAAEPNLVPRHAAQRTSGKGNSYRTAGP